MMDIYYILYKISNLLDDYIYTSIFVNINFMIVKYCKNYISR